MSNERPDDASEGETEAKETITVAEKHSGKSEEKPTITIAERGSGEGS